MTAPVVEPDHVYDAVAADLGIDPAALAADLERAIVQPLVVGGGK